MSTPIHITPLLLAAAATALVAALAGSAASAPPMIAGCSVFPASSPWNTAVDRLPVAADSARLIASIGAETGVHADFGSGLYDGSRIGIPYVVVHALPRDEALRRALL